MSSSRLPGKVMKAILGKPMIGHMFERLSSCKNIDKIVLATSKLPENDAMCEYAHKQGVEVYRGSEDDVLDRYYQLAKLYNPDAVVRVTGDCPLIDPKVCDDVISVFKKERPDYVKTGPSFAEGVDCEVVSFKALKEAWQQAKFKSEREHVTLYLFNHASRFKMIDLENKTDDSRYRIVVDEEEDFKVVTAIFEHFKKQGQAHFFTEDIKRFLDAHKELWETNAHIIRNEGLIKSLANDEKV